MTVRSANFRVCPYGPLYWGSGGTYRIGTHQLLDNRLFFINLDNTFSITAINEIDIHTIRNNFTRYHFGFEDARLFSWKNRWRVIVNIPGQSFIDRNDMAMIELENIIRDDHITLWESPLGLDREKNWTPVVNGNSLFIIYGWNPLLVYEVNSPGNRLSLFRQPVELPRLTDWHGSSQGLKTKNGWLFVIHIRDMHHSHFYHIHRFIELDDDFMPIRLSDPFVFLHNGIEFCAGMTEKDNRLIMSFGAIHDDHAFVCTAEKDEIDTLLHDFRK